MIKNKIKKNNIWDYHQEAHMNDLGFEQFQNSPLLPLSLIFLLSHYSFSYGALYTSNIHA